MIYKQTILKVVDNTGAKFVKCIKAKSKTISKAISTAISTEAEAILLAMSLRLLTSKRRHSS